MPVFKSHDSEISEKKSSKISLSILDFWMTFLYIVIPLSFIHFIRAGIV